MVCWCFSFFFNLGPTTRLSALASWLIFFAVGRNPWLVVNLHSWAVGFHSPMLSESDISESCKDMSRHVKTSAGPSLSRCSCFSCTNVDSSAVCLEFLLSVWQRRRLFRLLRIGKLARAIRMVAMNSVWLGDPEGKRQRKRKARCPPQSKWRFLMVFMGNHPREIFEPCLTTGG